MRDFIDLDIIESWERNISILDEIDDISDTIELGKLGINALSLDTEKEVVWVEVVNDDEGREDLEDLIQKQYTFYIPNICIEMQMN